MSDSGAIRAGRAYVELYGEDTGLDKTLTGSSSQVSAWGARINAAGAAVQKQFGTALNAITTRASFGTLTSGARSLTGALGRVGRASATAFQDESVGKFASQLNKRAGSIVSDADIGKAKGLMGVLQGVFATLQAGGAQIMAVAGPLVPLMLSLFTPIVAIPVALAAGVGAWLYFSGEGSRAIEFLKGTFGELLTDFYSAWGGITTAIGSGDLVLAGEIAWAGLKLTFLDAVKAMGGNWTAFRSNLLVGLNYMRKTFTTSFQFIGDAWSTVLTGMQTGWRSAQNFLAKGITRLLGLIEGRDVSEELKTLDEMATADNNKATAKRDEAITQREAATQKRLAEQEAQLQASLAALPESDEAHIAQLREQLAALNTKAATQAAEVGKSQFEANLPKAASDPEKIRNRIAGTFNAAAVQGLGGGSAVDKIAQNTAETAKALKQMLRAAGRGEIVFGGGAGF